MTKVAVDGQRKESLESLFQKKYEIIKRKKKLTEYFKGENNKKEIKDFSVERKHKETVFLFFEIFHLGFSYFSIFL